MYAIINLWAKALINGMGYVYSLQYHIVWCCKCRKQILKKIGFWVKNCYKITCPSCLSFLPIPQVRQCLHSSLCSWFLSSTIRQKTGRMCRSFIISAWRIYCVIKVDMKDLSFISSKWQRPVTEADEWRNRENEG